MPNVIPYLFVISIEIESSSYFYGYTLIPRGRKKGVYFYLCDLVSDCFEISSKLSCIELLNF